MNACGPPSCVKSRVYPPDTPSSSWFCRRMLAKGAADHYLVVAATAAQRVVVLAGDAVRVEVLRGRGAWFDRAGRADVVGGQVTQQGQHAHP